MSVLMELTNQAIAKFRSIDSGFKVMENYPVKSTSNAELEMAASVWRAKYSFVLDDAKVALQLPTALTDYFQEMRSDGVFFSLSVQRAGPRNDSATVGCHRLNRIAEIVPALDVSEQSFCLSVYGKHGDVTGQKTGLEFAAIKAFVLSPSACKTCGASSGEGVLGSSLSGSDLARSTYCEVLLVYRVAHGKCGPPEVWGRHDSCVFFLCRCVEDYLRLGAMFCWVSGWQLCYAPSGPPAFAIPWLRLLCPNVTSAALCAV